MSQTRDRSTDVDAREDVMEERVTTSDHQGLNSAVRAIASLVAAVPVVVAIVALIRMDWSEGFQAPAVDVLGMPFTPVVAVVTLILGLLALGAAAGPDRTGKLVMGAVLGCIGLAIVLAGTSREDLDLANGHGWMALIVGVVLLLAGLALRNDWAMRREVRGAHVRS